MLKLVILFLVLAMEAIYVARLVRKFIPKSNIFFFMPLYIVTLWLVLFFTLLLGLLIHPGS